MEFASAYILTTPLDPAVDFEEIDETDYSGGVQRALQTNVLARGDDVCLLDILDTAGQEEYSSMREQWTRSASAYLIVYSVKERTTFDEAQAIYEFCCRVRGLDSIPAVLCANKSDLARFEETVPFDEAEAWGRARGVPVLRTSAKTGMNVDTAFTTLVQRTPRTGIEYKIAVLGSGGVGKSSITVQFTQGCFVECYDPTIEDSYRKQIIIPGISSMAVARPKATVARSSSFMSRPASRVASGSSSTSKRSSGFFSSLFGRSNPAPVNEAPPAYSGPSSSTSPSSDKPMFKPAPVPTKKIRRVPKADTNVVLINLGSLAEENFDRLEVRARDGPPPACAQCTAALGAEPVCPFCGKSNDAPLGRGLSAAEEYTLVHAAAPAKKPVDAHTVDMDDHGLAVFCIDVSGSMSITQEVKQLQGLWQQLKQQQQSSSQAYSSSDREYVTRLACMKEAMLVHLERLHKHFPRRKVAILAFSGDVQCFFGAGLGRTFPEDAVPSLKDGILAGKALTPSAWPLVDQCYDALVTHTQGLVTRGSTAIGSALALAIGLAKAHKAAVGAATEIFVCTDGQSNTGIGDTGSRNSGSEHGRGFYARAGELAVDAGATIHVIGIAGEGVALDVLSAAAQASGGLVSVVDASELRRELRTATQKRAVAANVALTLRAPRGWAWERDARPGVAVDAAGTTLRFALAQVHDATTIGFAFAPAPKGEKRWTGEVVPFQARVAYTSAGGDSRVRILSGAAPATADRSAAEAGVRVAALGTHAVQRAGGLASALLAEGALAWNGARARSGALRDGLFAAAQLAIRGAQTTAQQEELGNFTAASEALDAQLERVFRGAFPVGVARDDAVRAFTRDAGLGRDALLSGRNKASKVQRSVALI